MRKILITSIFILALTGGFAFAQDIDSKSDAGKKQEVPVVDHAKYCTKNMQNVSGHDNRENVIDQKQDNSSEPNKPQKSS